MRKISLCILFLLLYLAPVCSQKITGYVVSLENKPIAFANVVLNCSIDSVYITGCVSQENGSFCIFVPQDDKGYYLTVSCLGYKTVKRSCKTGDDLNIVLLEDVQKLDEVIIKKVFPKTELKGDALVTNVANSALAKLGTAKNVLTKIPGLIEQNNNIEVFGKGSPDIYVNNRKIRDINELYQINANDIKKVEVIASPGVHYDATANAIVRIITNQMDDGFAINLRSDNEFSHYYLGNHQLDLYFKNKKLELFGDITNKRGKRKSKINSMQKTFSDVTWQLNNITENRKKCYFDAGKIGYAYTINENNSFGGYYKNVYLKENTSTTNNCDVWEDEVFYDKWDSNGSSIKNKRPYHEINIYYKGEFAKLSLDFNADYIYSKTNNGQKYQEESQNYEDRKITIVYENKNKLFAEKVVLSYPLLTGTMSIGEEYVSTTRNNNFLNHEKFLSDGTNDINEDNVSAFIEQSVILFRTCKINFGLRYENVCSAYAVDKNVQCQKKTYINLFPSFSLSFPINDAKFSLSFNSKMSRPTYSQLDGNTSYINRFIYEAGNPSLRPTKKTIISSSFFYKWCYLSATYTHSKDEIVYCSESMEKDPKFTLVTYNNFDKLNKLTLYCSMSPKFGIWNPTINIGLIQQWFEMPYGNGGKRKYNSPIILTQFNNTLEVKRGYTIILDTYFQKRGNNQNMMLNDLFRMNLSLGKALFHERLNLRVDCNDIFGTYRFKPCLYSTRMIVNQENIVDTRNIMISLNFKLNSLKKSYKGMGAGNSEKYRF